MFRIKRFTKFAKRAVSAFLYIGCITFVIHRGYMCFSKYLSKPEGVEIAYDFIGDTLFPSFTFCSNNWNPMPPHRYNEKVMKDCNLTLAKYAYFGHYIGNGRPVVPIVLTQKLFKTQLGLVSMNWTFGVLCYVLFHCSGVPLSTVGLQGAYINTSVHPLYNT